MKYMWDIWRMCIMNGQRYNHIMRRSCLVTRLSPGWSQWRSHPTLMRTMQQTWLHAAQWLGHLFMWVTIQLSGNTRGRKLWIPLPMDISWFMIASTHIWLWKQCTIWRLYESLLMCHPLCRGTILLWFWSLTCNQTPWKISTIKFIIIMLGGMLLLVSLHWNM